MTRLAVTLALSIALASWGCAGVGARCNLDSDCASGNCSRGGEQDPTAGSSGRCSPGDEPPRQ